MEQRVRVTIEMERNFFMGASGASRKSEACSRGYLLHVEPEDVYCTLSVRLMEVCAPVLTSDAVTTTV
jgi:hypothetical protein